MKMYEVFVGTNESACNIWVPILSGCPGSTVFDLISVAVSFPKEPLILCFIPFTG